MLDAFHVVVPALDRRLPGVLHPVEGPCAGVLLLDGTGAQTPLVSRLYAELELYFQSMDLVTLRLSIAPSAKMGRRVSGVLGGVSLLRSMGAEHVLLITSALDPIATREEVSAGTLDSLVDLAAQGHALPEIIQIVRDLTVTIRDVADSVIGVATLLARPASASASHSPKLLPMRTSEASEASETEEETATDEAVPAASLPALLLALPSEDGGRAAPAVTAQLITQLYSWSLALMHPERETRISRTLLPEANARHVPNGRTETARQVCGDWFTRRRWMDEQWEAIVEQLASRAPARAVHARASGEKYRGQGDGWSLRIARSAWWTDFDSEARIAWLQVCSQGFTSGTLHNAPANDLVPAAVYELAQTCS